jgi:hypothetical protein
MNLNILINTLVEKNEKKNGKNGQVALVAARKKKRSMIGF